MGEDRKYHTIHQFTPLTQLQDLANNPDNIYPNNKSLSVITNNGDLYVAGDNSYRRLAIEIQQKYGKIAQFTKVDMDKPIKLISHGTINQRHTFILTQTNELYASGCNYSGVFCDDTATGSFDVLHKLHQVDYTQFLTHSQNEYITHIECGRSSSLFLTNYGLVYGAGNVGDMSISIDDAKLMNMNNDNTPIIMIRSGYDHMLALDEKNRLITAGNNDLGQAQSTKSIESCKKPVFHSYFKDNDIKLRDIQCSNSLSMVIDVDDNCYMFGWNNKGQTGCGDKNTNCIHEPHKVYNEIEKGSLSRSHVVLLTRSNKVITFGNNSEKQCSPLKTDNIIFEPHILSKPKEIGILPTHMILNVIALSESTTIIVNPNKNVNVL